MSPVELSTDWFLDQALREVQKCGARRAVLDSLTSLAVGVLSERRFKELVYAFTKHFRAMGVTLNMNMEIAELLGSAQALRVRGLVRGGQRDPAPVHRAGRAPGARRLRAQGARGKHSTEVRRMSLEAGGVEIGSPFKGLHGVLTGLPFRAGGEGS